MELLNLSVPEQHDYNDPTVERDAERLGAWGSIEPRVQLRAPGRRVRGGEASVD